MTPLLLDLEPALAGLVIVAFWALGFPSLIVLVVSLAEHLARKDRLR